jgi:sigma-B regulation protein RsbU (phosphoserine phosphatase)
MALSWSLIWNYAIQYPNSPQPVFENVNQRLMMHLGGSHFLTCFYAVLDPKSGSLIYCNAGHPPPLHLKKGKGKIDKLDRTGPPLGVLEQIEWGVGNFTLQSGETLILYTDGVTDSCNTEGVFYGTERLFALADRQRGKSAQVVLKNLLTSMDDFVGDEVQFDDTAMIVLRHK